VREKNRAEEKRELFFFSLSSVVVVVVVKEEWKNTSLASPGKKPIVAPPRLPPLGREQKKK
jgi:hypothetical protein